ncbi:hypothetical protein Tco_0088094 [Tanacetum coccineum]
MKKPEAQGRKSQADPQDSSIQGLVIPPTTKVHASGEEQVEDISPNTLEAAKTLSKGCLFKVKVHTGSIELNTVIDKIESAGENKGQKEKESCTLTKRRGGKQISYRIALLAQRIAEEEELTEQQKKRKAQVQFEAQYYTNEDWDLIRAKNMKLIKSLFKEHAWK